jgi:stringent starvation protein B
MDVPVEVLIHNEIVGMKGTEGTLLQIGDGFYELNCRFGGGIHRILLPIASTVLFAKEQEERFAVDFDIER